MKAYVFKNSMNGFSLVELMVAMGIGTIVSLSMASLVADSLRSTKSVQTQFDYVSFGSEIKAALRQTVRCDSVFGAGATYTGTKVAQNEFNVITAAGENVQKFTADETKRLAGTNISLKSIELLDAAGLPEVVKIVENGNPVTYNKYQSKLRMVLQKGFGTTQENSTNFTGGAGFHPIDIPLTIVAQQGTNTIKYCGTEDSASICAQMGGDYKPGDPTLGESSSCNIVNKFGGCKVGGSYSLVNNSCSSTNPYTGACSCGSGYVKFKTVNYNPNKGADLVQYQCLNCQGADFNATQIDSTASPIYNEQMLASDLACLQDPTACPCYDPNSDLCKCSIDPTLAVCSDPCVSQPNGCTCILTQAQLSGDYTQAYAAGCLNFNFDFGGL